MKKSLIIFTLLIVSTNLMSQGLQEINQKRINRTKKGMLVLGSWAAANVITAPIFRNNTSGSEKYFHEMNGYWNIVNLAIAGAGYIGIRSQNAGSLSLSESIEEQQKIEKLLLFNAGLDIGYIFAGAFLNEKGKSDKDLRLEGYGQSLMLQGGFLAAFDMIFYIVQKKGSESLEKLLSTVSVNSNGLTIIHRF